MIFSIIVQVLLFILVAFFVTFTCYEIIEGQKKVKQSSDDGRDSSSSDKVSEEHTEKSDTEEYDIKDVPTVSILLPVCNEVAVVGQLIKAVSEIEYVDGAYEILLLDDSNEENATAVKRIVEEFNSTRNHADSDKDENASEGFRSGVVQYYSRESKDGFKAGNINYGLMIAKGDFVVVFDADCVPPSDFLIRTIPCFHDSSLGFLQTAIDFRNRNENFITRFLATEIGHKDKMTANFNEEQDLANLTGSSSVWRRKCLDDIGGFSDRTLTEDIDLCYRAQLKGWHYRYLSEVVSHEELPDTISAVRLQRHRWAYGLVRNTFLHICGFAGKSDFTLGQKLNAFMMMSQTFLLASFYALLLIAVPAIFVTEDLGWIFRIICTVFLITAIVWGYNNICGINLTCQTDSDDNGRKNDDAAKEAAPQKTQESSKTAAGDRTENTGCSFLESVAYVLMYLPLSLYYFLAVIEVLLGINVSFVPTPKGGAVMQRNRLATVIFWLEVVSFIYALSGMVFSICYFNLWTLLYTTICTCGFGISLALSAVEGQRRYFENLKHVVITGATGEIGGALARKFARRGMHMTLSGRNEAKLNEIKAQCEKQGAEVDIRILDLRNVDELRAWGSSLADKMPVDLLIANAGLNTNIGEDLEGEPFEEARALVEVNLLSDIALIDSVLPAMRKRGRGQIAILSSLASYYGLVYTPTYCATKAALRNYGNSLRAWLKPDGIKINVILPGYIDSPMCRAMPGPKPFLMKSDRAAGIITRGLYLNLARISFPFPLNLGIWSLSFLPHCLAAPIAALFGYGRMK